MKPIAIVTGSAGLLGSAVSEMLCKRGMNVIGIDNDLRARFFGPRASVAGMVDKLSDLRGYQHIDMDIRDRRGVRALMKEKEGHVRLICHCASQPSHDWSARDPEIDFAVNAVGTLRILEATRAYASEAVFVFISTNKVYGDTPNRLDLHELPTRFDVPEDDIYYHGVDETMSIERSMHSLFGASKLAADILVQEYGRYFGMSTVCFRSGCITGGAHAGVSLHGFLSHLMRCVLSGRHYTVYGYEGKQVRDNIDASDFAEAIWQFYLEPRCAEVYNIGGGRMNSVSVHEAIALCEDVAERRLDWSYSDQHRRGDHKWWITNTSKLQAHYPEWRVTKTVKDILKEIRDAWA